MTDYELYATCLPGLEALLLDELVEYGIGKGHAAEGAGVRFAGGADALMLANQRSGVAIQVRVTVAAFHVTKLAELERKARSIPFRDWFRTRPKITVRSRKSRLYHTGAVAERIQRALDAQLPAGDSDGSELFVRLDANKLTCSFNTSGAPLHRRGYRLQTAKAPLREDLARALLRATWDRQSPLLDPMAGSGTIAVEAALLATDRINKRAFAFEQAPCLEGRTAPDWSRQKAPEIFASDRNAGAIDAASANAERAGVRELLDLRVASLSDAHWQSGITVVTNPPFGKRVGKDLRALRPLFGRLGRNVRDHAQAFGLIFPHGARLERALELPLTSRLMTDHGGIKVDFLRWRDG
ncbi:MAG: class I SAM-dependent RNA methyltransferase [Myxococcota bacterium]